jgi:hypothetical protein
MVCLLSVTMNSYLNILFIQECLKYCPVVLAVLSLLLLPEEYWLVLFIDCIICVMMFLVPVTQTV